MTEENNKIPKIIHYCWFGNADKSTLAKKCLNSWRNFLPEYSFIEWNEKKIDISSNQYIEKAYKNKKYSFVADYVRIYALYHYGGIYLDLDVEVKKNFNDFLCHSMFFSFEDKNHVSTAVIGSVRHHFFLKELLQYYNFQKDFTLKTNVDLITQKLVQYGLKENNQFQNICRKEITIFPNDYFSPLEFGKNIPICTQHTVTIHWFEGTWQDKKIQRKLVLTKFLKKIISQNLYYFIIRRIKGDDFSTINIAYTNFELTDSILQTNLKYYSLFLFTQKSSNNMLKNNNYINIVIIKNYFYFILYLVKYKIRYIIVSSFKNRYFWKLVKLMGIKIVFAGETMNNQIKVDYYLKEFEINNE